MAKKAKNTSGVSAKTLGEIERYTTIAEILLGVQTLESLSVKNSKLAIQYIKLDTDVATLRENYITLPYFPFNSNGVVTLVNENYSYIAGAFSKATPTTSLPQPELLLNVVNSLATKIQLSNIQLESVNNRQVYRELMELVTQHKSMMTFPITQIFVVELTTHHYLSKRDVRQKKLYLQAVIDCLKEHATQFSAKSRLIAAEDALADSRSSLINAYKVTKYTVAILEKIVNILNGIDKVYTKLETAVKKPTKKGKGKGILQLKEAVLTSQYLENVIKYYDKYYDAVDQIIVTIPFGELVKRVPLIDDEYRIPVKNLECNPVDKDVIEQSFKTGAYTFVLPKVQRNAKEWSEKDLIYFFRGLLTGLGIGTPVFVVDGSMEADELTKILNANVADSQHRLIVGASLTHNTLPFPKEALPSDVVINGSEENVEGSDCFYFCELPFDIQDKILKTPITVVVKNLSKLPKSIAESLLLFLFMAHNDSGTPVPTDHKATISISNKQRDAISVALNELCEIVKISNDSKGKLALIMNMLFLSGKPYFGRGSLASDIGTICKSTAEMFSDGWFEGQEVDEDSLAGYLSVVVDIVQQLRENNLYGVFGALVLSTQNKINLKQGAFNVLLYYIGVKQDHNIGKIAHILNDFDSFVTYIKQSIPEVELGTFVQKLISSAGLNRQKVVDVLTPFMSEDDIKSMFGDSENLYEDEKFIKFMKDGCNRITSNASSNTRSYFLQKLTLLVLFITFHEVWKLKV